MSPLSNTQKGLVGAAARRAYLAWDGRDHFERVNSNLTATDCFKAWRHVEQGKAVGIQSLLECTQDHYKRLLAHFMALAGEEAGARRAMVDDAANPKRIALFKLREALAERELEISYAAGICRAQFKKGLDDASAKQIWNLVYTVRNRRKPVAAAPRPPGKDNPF